MYQNFLSQRLFDLKCFKDYPVGDIYWRYKRELSKVRKLVVHHTAVRGSGKWEKDVETIWNFHQARGWKSPGYHFLITSENIDGYAVVAYIGNIDRVKAHDPNEKGRNWSPINKGNEYSIGISFMNDHSKYKIIDSQLRSAKILIEDLFMDGRLSASGWSDVLGHGYSSRTWCPDGAQGDIIIPQIQTIEIKLPINNPQMDINWDVAIPEALEWDKQVALKRIAPGAFKDLKKLIADSVNDGKDFGSQIINDEKTESKQKLRAILKEFTDTCLDNKNELKKEEIMTILFRFLVYFEMSEKVNSEFKS